MIMYTRIILLLFGLAAVAGHVLKEPEVNPCPQEYKEPTRKFTNGHGFQYLYRRRPLEIVQKRPAKIEDAADITVPTAAAEENTTKVTVPKPVATESTTKVTVSSTTETVRDVDNVEVPTSSTSNPNTDKVTATKNRRNDMFNAMRERYHTSKNKNSNLSNNSRQKREINNKSIPEAPTLPKLDIQSFPEYVQRMLSDKPHLVDKPNKNSYNDHQHIGEVIQASIESKEANIKHKNTEEENLSNIDKEVIPSTTIKEDKSDKLDENNLEDKPILIEEPKGNDKPNNNSNDNIKDRLNEMFANINRSLSPPENSKVRTYGMSLKGGEGNTWNELAGIQNFKIETTTVTPVIKIVNKTTTIINDTDLVAGSGQSNDENNNNKSSTNQSHLTTAEPKISSKTTLEPKQKVKRFSEDNAATLKQETNLRDKMEESFKQILEKFPPFETITNKNATTEIEIDKEPKTYGMNLTGSHGYVWNELTKPGVGYNVGETEMSNTTDQINTESTTSPTTEKNASENSCQSSTDITGTENTSEVSTSNEKDINTTHALDATEITSESATTESEPLTTEITSESTTTESEPPTTEITSESTPLTTEEQPDLTSTTEQNDKDDKENTNQEDGNKDKNPVQISLDELLEKDEFWDWLSKWTTTYMDVFNENIKEIVKDEVAKQVKDYMNNNTKINKDEENNKDAIENDKKPTEIDHGILDNKSNNTNNETNKTKENEDDKSNVKDKGNSETNIEKEANKLDQKIKQTPLNVTAKSIYGGAVGNDHVTNIFIFNTNGQANETIQSLLDGISHKNSTKGNPVNTSLNENDKDNNPDETTTSTTLSDEKEKPDKNDTTTTTSNPTDPSNITSTTIDLAEEDEQDNENNDTTTEASTIESSTINNEDAIDSKTELTTADLSIETLDDTITEAITSSSTAATTLAINDDVEEDVSDINSTVVSLTPSSTDKTESTMADQSIETTEDTITEVITSSSTAATTLAINDDVENVSDINSTVVSSTPNSNEATTLTSKVIDVYTEEYECDTNESTELLKLEINIGGKNTDNNNVRKCVPKEKKKPPGLLASLGVSLKNPLKGLLNI